MWVLPILFYDLGSLSSLFWHCYDLNGAFQIMFWWTYLLTLLKCPFQLPCFDEQTFWLFWLLERGPIFSIVTSQHAGLKQSNSFDFIFRFLNLFFWRMIGKSSSCISVLYFLFLCNHLDHLPVCSYLLILDRTNWKTNILTGLLIPYIFFCLPSLLFNILRWSPELTGRWSVYCDWNHFCPTWPWKLTEFLQYAGDRSGDGLPLSP